MLVTYPTPRINQDLIRILVDFHWHSQIARLGSISFVLFKIGR